MHFSRPTVFAALWASLTQVNADADGTNYEIDAYGSGCGNDRINSFHGIAEENGSSGCMPFAAPCTCFTTSVGPDVKGGCLFVLFANSECSGDTTAVSSNNAGQTQNVTSSDATNSVNIVCQPSPT